MDKLKPCPFCGERGKPIFELVKRTFCISEGIFVSGLATWLLNGKCVICGVKSREYSYIVEAKYDEDFIIENYAHKAIEAWNTRKGEENG